MTQPSAQQSEQFDTGGVLTMVAGHAVHDTYQAFLAPLLPLFIDNFGLSTTAAGLLSVFSQGPSLVQPVIGHLADRLSLRMVVILAPAVSAITMSLLGVAPSYAVMALLLLAAGLSSAGLHSVGPVIAGKLSGRSLGRGMSYWMVGGELARTLGPILVVSAVQWWGLRGTPWLMIGGLLTSLLLFLRLRNVSDQPAGTASSLPWRKALLGMRPLLLPLTALLVARVFSMSMLTTYLPTFLSREGASLWLAGASLSLLEAAGVAGALTGGSISDRLGRRKVLFASMLTTPLLMLVFVAVGGWMRWPLLLLLGFTSLSVTPVIMALVQESYPENRALANGVYMAIGFVMRSIVVVILGAMGDFMGLRWAFVVSAIITLVGCPVVFLLPQGRPQGEGST
jgi:FSR family fosmidomycin resistance protein-like MFS transporter